jgi:spore germination protein
MKLIFFLLITLSLPFLLVFYFFQKPDIREYSNVQPTNMPEEATGPQVNTTNTTCAWLPWWVFDKALNQYEENNDIIDTINPFIYVLTPDGEIEKKVNESRIANLLGSEDLKVIPTISNDLDPERLSNLLNSPDLTEKHIDDIVALVKDYDFDGIEIDYEYLKKEDDQKYLDFISSLSKQIHAIDKSLTITLHPKTNEAGDWSSANAQDWEELAKDTDALKVMVYDKHYSQSAPGAISPYDWYISVVKYAQETIPKRKLTIAIGFYGYDWTDGEPPAKTVSLGQIDEIINNKNIEPEFDTNTKSPNFTYEENGDTHEVWFENYDSLEDKINFAKNNSSGICIWNLGDIPQDYFELLRS